MRSYFLLSLAILLFVIAQFLPAILPDMGAWNTPDKTAVPGWLVTALAWPFYVSNAVLVLGPLLVFLVKRLKKRRLVLSLLVSFYILTPFATLLFREAILDVGLGFYFWVGSYCAAAVGAAFALSPTETTHKSAAPTAGSASDCRTTSFWKSQPRMHPEGHKDANGRE